MAHISLELFLSSAHWEGMLTRMSCWQAERDLALQTLSEVKSAVAASEAARSATLCELQDAIQRERSSLEVLPFASTASLLHVCVKHSSTSPALILHV